MSADEVVITVRLPERAIQQWPHQAILREFHLIRTLKEAGIPLDGVNRMNSVTSGRLTIWRDFDLNDEIEHVYEWRGPKLRPVTVTVTTTETEDDEL